MVGIPESAMTAACRSRADRRRCQLDGRADLRARRLLTPAAKAEACCVLLHWPDCCRKSAPPSSLRSLAALSATHHSLARQQEQVLSYNLCPSREGQ